jgi:hypothetical protein
MCVSLPHSGLNSPGSFFRRADGGGGGGGGGGGVGAAAGVVGGGDVGRAPDLSLLGSPCVTGGVAGDSLGNSVVMDSVVLHDSVLNRSYQYSS